MISAETAIHRFRRDLALGVVLRWALGAAAGAALCLNFVPGRSASLGMPLMLVVAVLWSVLNYRGMKDSRLAAGSAPLIAAGQYDQAEEQIAAALKTFSISPAVKLIGLQSLAMLRHDQGRWHDSAMLCRALLGPSLGPRYRALLKPSHLMLANALLQLGDLHGAYQSLCALYQQRLSLAEALNLLQVQLDYEARLGAWVQMLPPGNEMPRIQLAELMPAPSSASTQALLALAALKSGRPQWAQWLRRRAELLAGDITQLTTQRPALWELWSKPSVGGG